MARQAVGDPRAEEVLASAAAVPYPFTSISTGGLYRVDGTAATAAGRTEWSAFVKLVQHPRHWPLLPTVPDELVAELLAHFPWRDELEIRGQVLGVLPPGLRVPAVYAVDDLGEDRLAVWMEHIDVDDAAWTPPTYRHAARCWRACSWTTPCGGGPWSGRSWTGATVRTFEEAEGPPTAERVGYLRRRAGLGRCVLDLALG